jgi:hypothetical protein
MKLAALSAAALLSLAGAANAQEHQDHSGHAQAPAPAAATAQFSINTPIIELVANPAAKAVLEKHLPGVEDHPAYNQFKYMSLAEVAPYSEGHVTDAMLAAIDAELKALPAEQ